MTVWLVSCTLVWSQPVTAAPLPTSQQGPTDPQELTAFFDQFFTSRLTALHVPGAAVAVVKTGQPFLLKGYGYANLERKTPVDPEQTVFGVGSITKLLTTTAVMQLVERHQIDLQADVNQYLPELQLNRSAMPPVTVESLLTHTSGFDDRFIGTAARTPAEVQPLSQYTKLYPLTTPTIFPLAY